MLTLTFRPMSSADFPLLHEWIHRPHVQKWIQDDADLEEVTEYYGEFLAPNSSVQSYIFLQDDVPIGYIQSYTALGSGGGWWEEETDPGVRGIDLWIGEESLLGQGIGTQLLRQFIDFLWMDSAVTAIQIDPSPDNKRAIACYKKVGFIPQGEITTPDGIALYMKLWRDG